MKLFFLAAVSLLAQQPGTVAIDRQEWRDQPVRHLYIHGVLNGDTAFQVLLPERPNWKGRLLHYLQGGLGGGENAGAGLGEASYALANGAAYVESSQGHRGPQIWRPEDTMEEISFQANYAVVQYAKSRCVEVYGAEPRYTYIYGMSGGGIRSAGMLERFPKVYDGAVPVVGIGSLDYLWRLHSIYEDYRVQPDGQRAIVQAGFPKVLTTLNSPLPPMEVSMLMLDVVKYKVDPAYYDDFWKLPGYASDRDRAAVVKSNGTVAALDPKTRAIQTGGQYPDQSVAGYTLTFTSGQVQGSWRRIAGNQGGTLVLDVDGPDIDAVKPGDTFALDNRDLLAFRSYHRLREKRAPAQRTGLLEPDRPFGKFKGKMIAVFGTHDQAMWPENAIEYRKQVAQPRSFRLHLVEYAGHGPSPIANRIVGWDTTERKAMDDLMRWVEDGVEPPAGTAYRLSPDNQIVLPATAAERQGYQPVAGVKAKMSGLDASFTVTAEDPDNEVVRIEIDYDGDGKFDESRQVRGRRVLETFRHSYAQAGQYLVTVRVTDSTLSKGSPTAGIQNLAHIDVAVTR